MHLSLERDTELLAQFLGPKAENADVFERLLLEAFRDHVFWRRNFHPEDGFSVTEQDRRAPAFQHSASELSQHLLTLLGLLKDGVPFHSPRYVGHMAGDTSMAAMAGYFAAMLYNPNNIVSEAAPATTRLELEVGRELATMVGYDPQRQWSHLTSGGTVANFEALWLARSVKYLPVAIRWAADALGLPVPVTLSSGEEADVRALSLWQLLNVEGSAALDGVDALLNASPRREEARSLLMRRSLAGMGAQEFQRRLSAEFTDPLAPAVVLVPSTAHYSWEKLCRALGIGGENLRRIPVDDRFRMDPDALDSTLRALQVARQPVLACITVVGSTEESAVDCVDVIARLRDRSAELRGLTFHLHADAAYGGYAAAITRGRDGRRRSFEAARADHSPTEWPSAEVFNALCALDRTDSITIDPHKLGYAPYPAGAICVRDGRLKELVAQEAPYAFGDERATSTDLGKFVFEGSKPGAAAAAVWMAHRALPLHASGYGRLIAETARAALRLHEALANHDFGAFEVVLLPRPDLNIVCFAVRHHALRTLRASNALIERVHAALSPSAKRPARQLEYFVSRTVLRASEYGAAGVPWAQALGFGPAEYEQAGGVALLRCAVMDPFLGRPGGRTDFLAGFLKTLGQVLVESLDAASVHPLAAP